MFFTTSAFRLEKAMKGMVISHSRTHLLTHFVPDSSIRHAGTRMFQSFQLHQSYQSCRLTETAFFIVYSVLLVLMEGKG